MIRTLLRTLSYLVLALTIAVVFLYDTQLGVGGVLALLVLALTSEERL